MTIISETIVTMEEAATLLKVSVQTVHRWAAEGKIRTLKSERGSGKRPGRRTVRTSLEELERFLTGEERVVAKTTTSTARRLREAHGI